MIKIQLPQKEILPSLPQNNSPAQRKQRQAALAEQQKVCMLTSDNHLGLPLMKLPIPEAFDFSDLYNARRGIATGPMLENQALVTPTLNPFAPFSGLSDFDKLYQLLETPKVAEDWITDASFGEQRLSGVNPVMVQHIACADDLPDLVDEEIINRRLGDQSEVRQLIEKGNLFLVDVATPLTNIPEGRVGHLQKYLPQAIGLFQWQSDTNGCDSNEGSLTPLAIQLLLDSTTQSTICNGNRPSATVITPDDGLSWTIAKILFNRV